MYYINTNKAIKHRNKIYKNFKDLETKFLEDTGVLYIYIFYIMLCVSLVLINCVLKKEKGYFG